MKEVVDFVYRIFSSSWGQNFTSNLLADIIVAVGVVTLLQAILERSKRPKKITFLPDSGPEILTTNTAGRRVFNVKLGIKNHDKRSALTQGVYWHVFAPKYINLKFESYAGDVGEPQFDENDNAVHFFGNINNAIFPTRVFGTGFAISGDLPAMATENDKIYYKLSTEFGIYPNGAEDRDERDQYPDFATLSFIQIR